MKTQKQPHSEATTPTHQPRGQSPERAQQQKGTHAIVKFSTRESPSAGYNCRLSECICAESPINHPRGWGMAGS